MAQADRLSVLRMPSDAAKNVSYTGTAGTIQQKVSGTCIFAWCTTDAYVTVGDTATTGNGTPLPAYTPIFLPIPVRTGLNQGETPTVLVSAIQIASGGTLYAQQFN